MTEQILRTTASKAVAPTLACRLRHQAGDGGRLTPIAGEVELENLSADPIEIEMFAHPLEHLDLAITDAAGRPVPAMPYGGIFSPFTPTPYIFRLAPGEKYTHCVSLLGTLPKEKRLPGSYTVRAIYDYNGLRAVSEPLQVVIPEKGGNGEPA
jgi:hypothetical protein